MVRNTRLHRSSPLHLLGLKYDSWTSADLRTVLDHFGRSHEEGASKADLYDILDTLRLERGLDKGDRLRILGANVSSGRIIPSESGSGRPAHSGRGPHPARPVPIPVARATIRRGRRRYVGPRVTKATGPMRPLSPGNLHIDGTDVAIAGSAGHNTGEGIEGPQCVVCYQQLKPTNRIQRKITSGCDHEPDVCKECLIVSIKIQFRDKMWDQIECPSCPQRLSHHDMQLFADKDTFNK